MVFDFRLADRALFDCDGAHGRARRDAPGPLRGPGPARHRRRRPPWRGRHRAAVPRDIAAAVRRGGRDGAGDGLRACGRRAASTWCTSRRPPRSTRSAAPGRPASGLRRDVPALPGPDRRALRRPDPASLRALRHLAAAPLRRRIATRCGPAWPTARWTSSRPTTCPTGCDIEKAEAARGVPFDQISNGAPGIETLLTHRLLRGRRARPDHARADGRPARRRRRRGCSGSPQGRDRGRAATRDLVALRPAARGRCRAADLHHTSDYTPYEGLAGPGRRPRRRSFAAESSGRHSSGATGARSWRPAAGYRRTFVEATPAARADRGRRRAGSGAQSRQARSAAAASGTPAKSSSLATEPARDSVGRPRRGARSPRHRDSISSSRISA